MTETTLELISTHVASGARLMARQKQIIAELKEKGADIGEAERTLDQVILEYLTNEAAQEQLVLVLESEADLVLGRRASLALRTSSSKSGLPIAGAQVSVRMISTIAEPRVLAVGRTDEHGGVPLRFEIPALDRGTAALIISAVSAIGRAELKHLL